MAKWIIDADHSVAAFRVRHMMVAYVRGQFNKLSGAVRFDPTDPSSLSLEVSLDAQGLYTGIAKRDEHLLSPDFFNLPVYPGITFKSTGFTETGSGGRLLGDLTIRGVAKPVAFEVDLAGPVLGPEDFGGETTLGISATTTINREDFGILWNVPLTDGGVMVGKDIEIYLDIEADIA